MQVDKRQYLRDGQTSNCWSLGSINHPSSQSRKISIGVVVDSLAKKKFGVTKEGEVVVPNAEMAKSKLGNTIQAKSKGEEFTASKKTKQTKDPEQVNSPWISPRSFHQKTLISDAILHAEQASNLPYGSGSQYKLDGARNPPLTYSVQFLADQTSILQTGGNKQKNPDGVTHRKRGLKDGMAEEVQDFTFAIAQEVIMSDKEVLEDKTDGTENRTETLRMKLLEIMGTVSSPNEQHSKFQAHEVGNDNLNPEHELDLEHKCDKKVGDDNLSRLTAVKPRQNSDKPEHKFYKKGNTFIKPRQNSDTIETDSESPDNTVRRPVTRSLIRKRAPTKVKQRTAKSGRSSNYKLKNQDKIFSFEQEFHEKLHGSAAGRSPKSMQKKKENKSFRIESHGISFPGKIKSTKIQQTINRTETSSPAKKVCSVGNNMEDFHGSLPENGREFLEVEKNIQEQEIYQSPLTNKKLEGDFDNAANKDQQEEIGKPCLKKAANAANPEDDYLSPTFVIKTPVSSSSPSSTPKSDQMVDVSSPALTERQFAVGDIQSFRSFWTSKQDFHDNAQTQSSDAAEELKDSPLRKTAPDMEENDAEDGLSLSSEERDLGSCEEGSPIIQGCEWTGEDNWIDEPSERNQVDGLARAVELFALELQKLKIKMKSATNRKSSEILMSVAAGAQLQLQNVESRIQTDLGKLTNLSKKRKRLETRFEEQEEQLKAIYDKFKEQVNQHLQDCRSTIEGLEVYQTEFKGIVEKQKASHRKLLLQVEEEIETQLNDAQRRIQVMHEMARGKMLQLKREVALCLKEGILC